MGSPFADAALHAARAVALGAWVEPGSGPGTKGSLCWLPREARAGEARCRSRSPSRRAGTSAALASSASSLSKTGSPRPVGTSCATQVDDAAERVAVACRASIDALAPSRLGRARDRGSAPMFASTSSQASPSRASTLASTVVHPRDPADHLGAGEPRAGACARWRPPATRPIVSRALARPPPCQLRMPYFASVVKSACDGR